ncbi:MAG TPA: hypothetical protein VGD56_17130 [Gemmatirosa sp.]
MALQGWTLIASVAVALVLGFFALDAVRPGGRRLARVEGMDAVAYFGVAHSMLFDHDFDLSNELQRVRPVDNVWTRIQPATGRPGSPYAIGYSLLATPFLGIGTWIDGRAGRPADGYAASALTAYSLANVVFVGTGLLCLFDFLLRIGMRVAPNASEGERVWQGAWVVCTMLVGTPVAYYAYSGMAHSATFMLASAFVACWARARDSTTVRRWAVLGIVGGLLSISRWQDIFFLGAPLLYDLGHARVWTSGDRRTAWLRSRLTYGAAAAVCWVPQLLEWKAIYGKFLTIPQGNGFLKFPPQFVAHVLFSSQHGWFVWTPIALLGVTGLVVGARRDAVTFTPWLVVVALEVLLMGAMPTNWSGTDSFGQRSLTSLVPLLAFGVATLLWSARRGVRAMLVAATAACAVFTLAFAAQFRLDLIPRDGRLTVQELLTDKTSLVRAVRRKHAVVAAGRLADAGDARGAERQLEGVERELGTDRNVLVGLVAAARLARDTTVEADAGRRLAAFRARELW